MDVSEEEFTPLMIRDRGGSQRSSSSTGSSLQVHLYFFPPTKDAMTIHVSSGQVSAENVCIQAAKSCGILPVYQSLFGLASGDLSFWYPPSHMFNTEENIHVHFRVRFFFGNWYGQGPRMSYRYSLTRDRISPVLDYSVIDYLFAQVRSDFITGEAGVAPPLSVQEECLGLAVLDLWRIAKERHLSIRELCKIISYKSCLPVSHRHDIQKRNRLDRYRIRNTLKRFLKKLGNSSVDEYSLKLKYLVEMAGIVPTLGSEVYHISAGSSQSGGRFTHVKVTGEIGIQTSGSRYPDGSLVWQTFCDFQDIIAISMKRVSHEQENSRLVTVFRHDDRNMEINFQSLKEALSFVSLVDGYFRLTTDSSHYFCRDTVPESILEGIKNHFHGPITSEFAVDKLKKSGLKGGKFLLRQSPKDFDNFFLTVCIQTPLGLDYKDCLIIKNKHYRLPGVPKSFSTLIELTSFYQQHKLLLDNVPAKLGHCCPPQPKELTNLIITRNGISVEAEGSQTPERKKFGHIQFHMIRYEDLKWGESLGQGSFTRVFKGTKTAIRDGEKHVTDVLLKELDGGHKNCWESFFEAASVMSQISHKHLILVYGISVHGTKNIMVQELVKYGALDLYLKRGQSMSVSWKLDIVKQLACALNFLEEKNIVHGNICAKNLLLAREGDRSQGTSPFIKLSDPGISIAMIGRDVILDRIPWVAPEVLEAPDKLTLECDKWSFGATVWEIFNNGNPPLQDWDLQQKQQFYESIHQLPPSQWTELAELISHCMNYKAAFRPSCRSLIRELNSLITSDYVILHTTEPVTLNPVCQASSPAQQDQTLFEERHLRYISLLGKGNFGSVELCRYDPLGDDTGEMVAVKKLQPNKQSTLEDFRKEIKTLSMMCCDYIVKYRGVCYSMGRRNMSLVMEYLPHGSLIVYSETNRHNINTRRMLLFASQICKGMAYLQTLRYVHRDLAARNILVASESLVKIADFGLTKIVPLDKEYYRVKQPGESPIFWYAPESINELRFSQKSDVWSFGVVLHELFSYCDMNSSPKKLCMQEIGTNAHGLSISMHLLNILKDNWRLPPPPNCPPKVYSLMKQCWVYHFEGRPCFSSLEDQIEIIMQEESERLPGRPKNGTTPCLQVLNSR
ncbi:tyrosine-protein kinase JAK2 isoform X1 [Hippocampus comes]|uniref:Tyrosine-protein kinase n=1 Tax=Hippocampus comes TaxID=109280 RepID=A0A3Q2XSC5_HIPCM|nr:PREDICTED: tyrosine-protein kinase JAK2-like isoform X1 [Hippocampus comes]XP_019730794.1 PREDICTED: tyrosine-protein kinase JAK2-like isoform X1 [Hippocampus comes]XP_019730795.1 PREDICTED: tyrosine-protein kinase JAK2-like isoform X1 [Hippocampus comes]XP_019730796.1 PREDICTED: tyrosine-protein kinase JAK2-like isoform X1 [Hippocampus comes]